MTTHKTRDETTDFSDGLSATEDAGQTDDTSRELLAKARYDAFRLMTEGREEAEIILDGARAEAAGIVKAAKLMAEAVAERAATKAEAIIQKANEDAAGIAGQTTHDTRELPSTEDTTALEQEHRELSERVTTLRSLADQLENRFAALTDIARDPVEPPPVAREKSTQGYSPPAAAPEAESEDTVSEAPTDARESFYNRRSAKLPRLGADGGRSAFEITRSIRESLDTDR